MRELWKDIPGYEGLYQASTEGRIKSLDRMGKGKGGFPKFYKGKYLKSINKGDGYYRVVLHKNEKAINAYVHRLVALTWIPNPDNLPLVNHKDENKANNAKSNLEWCDYQYNNTYGTTKKRMIDKQRRAVLQYTLEGEFIREWYSTQEIHRQTGWSQGNIACCCRGEYKTSYGYKWVYKN